LPTEDFHVKYRARQAHLAAVPLALEHARSLLIDFNGQPLADGEAQRDGLTAGELRTLVAEVDRLQALVKQQQRDAAEEQREFQREARSIAAEARWEAQEETRGGHY
jgi:hypothetical protein